MSNDIENLLENDGNTISSFEKKTEIKFPTYRNSITRTKYENMLFKQNIDVSVTSKKLEKNNI